MKRFQWIWAVPLLLFVWSCAGAPAHEMKRPMSAAPVPPEYEAEFKSLNAQADVLHRQIAPELSPKHAVIHLRLGVIYFKIGNYSEAVDNLTRSSLMNPDSPDVHLYLGRTFNATDRTDEAVEEYQTSLKLNPHQPEAHKELGDLYRQLGMMEAAESEDQYNQNGETAPSLP